MNLLKQKDFAQQLGKDPSYVTQLKSAGRLVITNGMVDVDASLKLIADTADPGRAAVVERHAQEREQKLNGSPSPTLDEMTGKAGSAYQQARAMKEKYFAMGAKIAYEKEVGLLLVASDVRFAIADGDTILCNRIESMFYALAPQLADERDEGKILAVMLDHWEVIRSDLSRKFNEMAKI
jgi:hypothetical protein